MADRYVFEVTGRGPSKLPGVPAKDKRGRWTGWKTVTVQAETKEEAIRLGTELLPADKRNEITVRQGARIAV